MGTRFQEEKVIKEEAEKVTVTERVVREIVSFVLLRYTQHLRSIVEYSQGGWKVVEHKRKRREKEWAAEDRVEVNDFAVFQTLIARLSKS